MPGATLTGDAALERAFRELPAAIQKRHLRRGVRKAGTLFVRAAKMLAPVETGLLRLSIGQRTYTHRDKRGVGSRIGPRHGFRRAVIVNKRGQVKRLSVKKQRAAVATGQSLVYRNPVKYAHLVEFGSKSYMTPAYEAVKSAAMAVISTAIREGLVLESLRFRGRR